MDKNRLLEILDQLKHKSILVVGDYFLDKYLLIDPAKNEPSIETGLTAFQVVGRRVSPGAAGTVTNNLSALGIGTITALGMLGDDGEALELIRGLEQTGVNTEEMIASSQCVTPTYTKPMLLESGGERELNRLDIKNWRPTPRQLEDELAARLIRLAGNCDAILVMDQVTERNYGTVTDRIRDVIAQIAEKYPALPIIADSRAFIGEYEKVIIKCNHHEAMAFLAAASPESPAAGEISQIHAAGKRFFQKTGRPVFVTHGSSGQYVMDRQGIVHVPGIPVTGPIDTVGAGDSTTAGIVSALCCGATFSDAALLGNLVASITITQLGTTGTASPEQVVERFESFCLNSL